MFCKDEGFLNAQVFYLFSMELAGGAYMLVRIEPSPSLKSMRAVFSVQLFFSERSLIFGSAVQTTPPLLGHFDNVIY
jgi:hypothetical protein